MQNGYFGLLPSRARFSNDRAMQRVNGAQAWISVGTSLPKDRERVLVALPDGGLWVAFVDGGEWFIGKKLSATEVTHWRPLPPEPEGD